MGKLNATDFLASTVVNFSHDFSDSKTNSELWKHSEFEVYFRGFCIINVISFFVIVSFLSKQAGNLKNFTSYRIYCIALACSDLLLSVDGFVAVSELDFAFHQEWALQLEAAIMMFAGLFSLNNHVVIACERLQATMISRPNRARIRLQARVNGNALLVVLGSLVMSLVWTLLASFCQGPGFALDSSGQSWGLNWRTDTVKSLVYIWMLMVFEFGIPIVIVVYVYVKIWLVIRNGKFPHQMTPRRRRIVIMCMISTASFLLAWVPYAVLGMFMIFGIPFGKVFSLTANTIAKTSCIYNTLILRHASDTSAPTTTPVNSRRRANGNNCPNNNPSNESWVRRMINRIRSCPSSAPPKLSLTEMFMRGQSCAKTSTVTQVFASNNTGLAVPYINSSISVSTEKVALPKIVEADDIVRGGVILEENEEEVIIARLREPFVQSSIKPSFVVLGMCDDYNSVCVDDPMKTSAL